MSNQKQENLGCSDYFGGFLVFAFFIWLALWIPRLIILPIAFSYTGAGENSSLIEEADECRFYLRHQTMNECLRKYRKYENYKHFAGRVKITHFSASVSMSALLVLVGVIGAKMQKNEENTL